MCASLTITQEDNFLCTEFDISVPTTCTCAIMENILVLKVTSDLGTVVALLNSENKDLNRPKLLVGFPTFGVLLSNSSDGILTDTLNFTSLPECQVYTITCDTTGANPSHVSIGISGAAWILFNDNECWVWMSHLFSLL